MWVFHLTMLNRCDCIKTQTYKCNLYFIVMEKNTSDNKSVNSGFGVHFMVDAYDAKPELMGNQDRIRKALHDIPAKLDMHTISEPVVVEVGPNNKKDPGGISGMIMIAESHLSFHTFPNRGFVTIDIYTCKDELDTESLINELKKLFGFTDYETHFIKRGVRYPSQDIF